MEEQFKDFHQHNPQVYRRLVSMALELRSRGRKHYGIAALYEVLRYEYALKTDSEDDFKLNNNHKAFYARKIMDEVPELRDFFSTRVQRSV